MTCKAAVLWVLERATAPVPTPEITLLTGYARGAVWSELVRLRRMGVVEQRYRRGRWPRKWELRQKPRSDARWRCNRR